MLVFIAPQLAGLVDKTLRLTLFVTLGLLRHTMSSDSPTPDYHYIAYIDESGDDGLKAVKPLSVPGSSEWLVRSAVVIRAENQFKVPGWVDNIRSGFRSQQARSLHFANLSPSNKIAACKALSGFDVRCFVVASNKKNMQGHTNPDAEKIPSQCWFYCWMTRILLERVTRFVLHRSLAEHHEPKFLRIEYSARGGLRYSQMSAYYEWLRMKRANPFLPWGKICFEVMHPTLLRVYPHDQREGLQLADIVAARSSKRATSTTRARATPNSLSYCGNGWDGNRMSAPVKYLASV